MPKRVEVHGLVVTVFDNNTLVQEIAAVDQTDAIKTAKDIMEAEGLTGEPKVIGEDFTEVEKEQGIIVA